MNIQQSFKEFIELIHQLHKQSIVILNEREFFLNQIILTESLKQNSEKRRALIETIEQLSKTMKDIQQRKELIISEMKTKEHQQTIESMKGILDEDEINQLEQWTSLSCGPILFDSSTDTWEKNMSCFNSRIGGKSHVLFLIEDTERNKFGYYLNTTVEMNKYNQWLSTDDKSFLFSLKSNGRIQSDNGMMKFEINETSHGYNRKKNSDNQLICLGFGVDIVLFKQHKKEDCFCDQNDAFNYHGIQHALCGKTFPERFIPQHFLVLQMK